MKIADNVLREAIEKTGGFRPAERYLREQGYEVSERSLRRFIASQVEENSEEAFEVAKAIEIDIDDLLHRRRQVFEAKKTFHHSDRVRRVKVNIDGPIGVGLLGDTHIDADNADIKSIFEHAEIFDGRNPGMTAILLGDLWNNWHGRLARLWADQSTTGAEARALVEAYVKKVKWLAVVMGNHDLWSGHDNPLPYMLKEQTNAVRAWRIELDLVFPNGRTCRIYAAHRFPGRSMWSTVYGAAKKAQLHGSADIYACGDSHVSGYAHGWHAGNNKAWHAVQVASYKFFDDYVDEIGVEENFLYNAPVAIIDPAATQPINFIRFEFDPHEAAERLAFMRAKSKH